MDVVETHRLVFQAPRLPDNTIFISNKPKMAYSRDLAVMDYLGLSWTIMDYHGQSWTDMSWTNLDYDFTY